MFSYRVEVARIPGRPYTPSPSPRSGLTRCKGEAPGRAPERHTMSTGEVYHTQLRGSCIGPSRVLDPMRDGESTAHRRSGRRHDSSRKEAPCGGGHTYSGTLRGIEPDACRASARDPD